MVLLLGKLHRTFLATIAAVAFDGRGGYAYSVYAFIVVLAVVCGFLLALFLLYSFIE